MKRPLIALSMLISVAARANDLPAFTLELADGKITPQRLEVPAGKKFKLEIRNTGKTAAEFESKSLRKEKVLVPGTTSVMVINALPAGEYKFVEEYHENDAGGQGVIVAK